MPWQNEGRDVPYRSKKSYQSKDPAKRAKQLANLRPGNRKPVTPIGAELLRAKAPDKYSGDLLGFGEDHFYLTDTRKPIKMLPFQRDILSRVFLADQRPSLALIGMCKKSGKSTLAAVPALWLLCNHPFAEIYIMGPDLQQGQLVVFKKLTQCVRMNAMLRDRLKITRDSIENPKTDGVIRVLPCNKDSGGPESRLGDIR